MIQNSSNFSKQDDSEDKPKRKLMISRPYDAVKFYKGKNYSVCGEVEIIKDFHIEITSGGKSSYLEFYRGEVVDVVRVLFKKRIHLGFSPSGFYILSDFNYEYFKKIS